MEATVKQFLFDENKIKKNFQHRQTGDLINPIKFPRAIDKRQCYLCLLFTKYLKKHRLSNIFCEH